MPGAFQSGVTSAPSMSSDTMAAAPVVEPVEAPEPAPEPEPAEAVDEHPYGPGSYRGDNPPAGFAIKGNADSMKFHTPESPYYARTVAEVWFESVEAAEAAGFAGTRADQGAAEA